MVLLLVVVLGALALVIGNAIICISAHIHTQTNTETFYRGQRFWKVQGQQTDTLMDRDVFPHGAAESLRPVAAVHGFRAR